MTFHIILMQFAYTALLVNTVQTAPAQTATVISTGQEINLNRDLVPEGTTILLFVQSGSSMEQDYQTSMERELSNAPPGSRVALRVVQLRSLDTPAADQFGILKTPTVLVFDRWGHLLHRSADPKAIMAAVRKGTLMGRIKWHDEDDPKSPEVYGFPAAAIGRGIPGIVKTMGQRQEAMKVMREFEAVHFSAGFLPRREHEMIGAYVSALNKCKF